MSRRSGDSRPVMVGFEFMEGLADRMAGASEGYPPFNIEAGPDGAYALVLAVAGFSEDELSVEISGDDMLIVSGKSAVDGKPREYLHRGIAKRRFQRHFALAPGLEAVGAELDNGLLRVRLRRRPGADGVRKIKIIPT